MSEAASEVGASEGAGAEVGAETCTYLQAPDKLSQTGFGKCSVSDTPRSAAAPS